MGKRRAALKGAGAASIAALATLAGAPSASSQEVCVICPQPQPGGGSATAFQKMLDHKFPGATEGVFLKIEGAPPPAFYKLAENKFPGATEGVFHKG